MLDDERQQPEDIKESAAEVQVTGDEGEGDSNTEIVVEEQQAAPRRERRQRGERAGDAELEEPTEPPPAPRLHEQFRSNIVPTMMQEFS